METSARVCARSPEPDQILACLGVMCVDCWECVSELHPDGGSTASLPALNNTPVVRLHLSARDVSATACRRSILPLIFTSLPPLSASVVSYHLRKLLLCISLLRPLLVVVVVAGSRTL